MNWGKYQGSEEIKTKGTGVEGYQFVSILWGYAKQVKAITHAFNRPFKGAKAVLIAMRDHENLQHRCKLSIM